MVESCEKVRLELEEVRQQFLIVDELYRTEVQRRIEDRLENDRLLKVIGMMTVKNLCRKHGG